jgi:transglutaminase-like putative cysteine protease
MAVGRVADAGEEAGPVAGDDPRAWLGASALIDLDDTKLRLKARSLTQLSKGPREQALAIYGFVKRMELAKPMKVRFHTAREVLDAGSGDADDKATLLVGLLRLSGIPARLRYVELRGDILRGLTSHMTRAARPVAEVWLGRWVRTDTYIFDARYMAAARQRLKDHGWRWGYGIFVGGATLWNGSDDAFVGGSPSESDPMALRELPPVSDPQELVALPAWKAQYRRVTRVAHWNVLAPSMGRVIRELREEADQGPALTARKPS